MERSAPIPATTTSTLRRAERRRHHRVPATPGIRQSAGTIFHLLLSPSHATAPKGEANHPLLRCISKCVDHVTVFQAVYRILFGEIPFRPTLFRKHSLR